MIEVIDKAKAEGDSVGGVVEVIAEGVPIRLGSARSLGPQAGRAASAGLSSASRRLKGSKSGSVLKPGKKWNLKCTTKMRGLKPGAITVKRIASAAFEGGMTSGAPIVVRGVMKPIPTLSRTGWKIVDIDSKETFDASISVRTVPSRLPASSSKGLSSWEIACALCDKLQHVDRLARRFGRLRRYAKEF